ncbi:MAG: tRNA preQ1(34) S-adenosylmethionine ribosyltransferase-isomerase QueA [Beijerinckiaceae bacterium]
MMHAPLQLSDFDFDLPDANIALRPAIPRESARMLLVNDNGQAGWQDKHVRDLVNQLRAGDVMVFNDTRVIPARMDGVRKRGDITAKVEITLHKRAALDSWIVFAKPGKRLAVGDRIRFGGDWSSNGADCLDATVMEKSAVGDVTLRFDVSAGQLDASIARIGHMPLPPYIAQKRPTDAQDVADYQTVYAAKDGAVAAPTAGLHFTPELLAAIDAKGVARHHVTLHVGAGTFLPVKVENLDTHHMHSEWGHIPEETAQAINTARAKGGRLICVGTTSLRIIETAAAEDGSIQSWSGDTSIFIRPGYRFKAVDGLMTNFHLPRSTLFMLVSAFAGYETMRDAYAHAINTGYRFYSYGDSSLLWRAA